MNKSTHYDNNNFVTWALKTRTNHQNAFRESSKEGLDKEWKKVKVIGYEPENAGN